MSPGGDARNGGRVDRAAGGRPARGRGGAAASGAEGSKPLAVLTAAREPAEVVGSRTCRGPSAAQCPGGAARDRQRPLADQPEAGAREGADARGGVPRTSPPAPARGSCWATSTRRGGSTPTAPCGRSPASATGACARTAASAGTRPSPP